MVPEQEEDRLTDASPPANFELADSSDVVIKDINDSSQRTGTERKVRTVIVADEIDEESSDHDYIHIHA